ncbi:hypothetical protein [Cystobacter fuscus]|uniref:hypothetical protein n=1 Tax=Cystobacter fuscus TaxID=43 RepID=UPI002B292BCE|nr:hypothetical protein F0U63_26120 [Cystobacter fuscus]
MSKDQPSSPVATLRHLALSLERLVAHEAAKGVVGGAADGLRKELPGLDAQLRTIVQDALTVLGRLLHEAAEHERVDPGATAQTMAASAMQGLLDVLEREWQDGGMPMHSLVERFNLLLDEIIDFTHSRTDEIRTPRERAQAMTEAVVDAALGRVHDAVPVFAEDLRAAGPLGEEVASAVGRGLVTGLGTQLQKDAETLAERTAAAAVRGASGALTQQVRAWNQEADALAVRRMSRDVTAGVLDALAERLRRPLLAVASAGGVMALTLLAARWRRA